VLPLVPLPPPLALSLHEEPACAGEAPVKSSISVSTSYSLYRLIPLSPELTGGVVGGSPYTGIFQKLIKRTIANIFLQCFNFMLFLHRFKYFPVPFMEEPEYQNQQHQNQHPRRPGNNPFPKTVHVTPY
jgi:hypothetical protein